MALIEDLPDHLEYNDNHTFCRAHGYQGHFYFCTEFLVKHRLLPEEADLDAYKSLTSDHIAKLERRLWKLIDSSSVIEDSFYVSLVRNAFAVVDFLTPEELSCYLKAAWTFRNYHPERDELVRHILSQLRPKTRRSLMLA